MNDLYIYLLKVSLGLAIISVPYYFLFRDDPNLSLKRFYLLVGLAVSWIFPLIAFRRPDALLNLTPTVFIDPSVPAEMPLNVTSTDTPAEISINWLQLSVIIYLGGLTFMFLKNLIIILRWNMAWQKSRHENGVAFTKTEQVFTLFTRIFIPRSLRGEPDLDNVLLHEKAHVDQLHFVDLTIMELTLLLTWFNPFSWLISRMIKENHEHLADRQALSAGINPARYRAQLLNHTLGVNVFRLGNQFNHSLTFKRFNMMKKPERSPMGIIKIALLVPVVLIAMGLTTGMKPQQEETIKGKVVEAGSEEPLPGAAVIIAGTTTGTVTDEKGMFMLNTKGDSELLISFVGYNTLRVKASDTGKKPLELETKTYTMDLDKVPIMVGKTDQGMISADEEQADNLKTDEGVFYIVEDMPSFPGGKAALKTYIYSNLEYPEAMKKKGISGEVYVQFLVNQTGQLEEISVARSTQKEFEVPALNVFNGMPAWNPGRQRQKPVNVRVVVPVRFSANI